MIRVLVVTILIISGGIPALGGIGLAHASGGIGVPLFGWLANKARSLEPTGDNLYKAAEEGNLETVKDLVARGANVNYGHAAPLELAAYGGHVEVVKFLLEAGANPNGSAEDDTFKGKILRSAARQNHLDIVNILLDAGATVTIPKYGVGLMDGPAKNGNIAIIERLLEAGADPNHGGGYTLLLAGANGHLDIMKAFIEAGADVNAGGGWIINNAAENGHLDIVKLLVESGVNKEDYGAAMEAASSSGQLEVVKYLLEIGTDPSYEAVLKFAAESGNIEVVRTLLEAGSTIKYDHEKGSTLHYAVIEGKPDIVSLLVDFGADINRALTKDAWFDLFSGNDNYGKGWTVAHVAARWGEPMIRVLKDLGADLNIPDAKGNTPLQVAINYDKLFVLQELLKFCADVTPANEEGKTALDLVTEMKGKNATNSTGYGNLMKMLNRVMSDKLATIPTTTHMTSALGREFISLMEANSTLKDQLNVTKILATDVENAIAIILEQRNRKGIVEAFADHKCKLSLPDQETVDLGTEYLAKCECVSGQGLQMTLTPIEDANLCEIVTTTVQPDLES